MPEYIRLDLFPAEAYVYSADVSETVRPSRVIVTDDEAFVYADGGPPPTGVLVKYSGRLEDFSGDPKVGYVIRLDDGPTIQVKRAGGCGCGSRLRGFRPFPGVPQIARF